jgi:hypothetical protein
MDEGSQQVRFDGSGLASGVYFYRIEAVGVPDEDGAAPQTYTAVRKMLLMK